MVPPSPASFFVEVYLICLELLISFCLLGTQPRQVMPNGLKSPSAAGGQHYAEGRWSLTSDAFLRTPPGTEIAYYANLCNTWPWWGRFSRVIMKGGGGGLSPGRPVPPLLMNSDARPHNNRTGSRPKCSLASSFETGALSGAGGTLLDFDECRSGL